jgi:hypothetical protein
MPKCSICGKEIINLGDHMKCSEQPGRIERHEGNWVYRTAREYTEEVRREQIAKGAEKYETPLGDAEWTALQLVHHAMQENIDQNHYLVMLRHEIQKLHDIIERQDIEIIRLERLLTP